MKATAAIVLCGGNSRRMGSPKHLLPFENTTLLGYQIDRLVNVFERIVVVLGPTDTDADANTNTAVLPMLRDKDLVCHDRRESAGPVEGLRVGLETVAKMTNVTEMAWVTACDVPFFQPSIAERLLELGQEEKAILFSEAGQLSPLPGWYSTSLHESAERFLARGDHKFGDFASEAQARIVPIESIAQNSEEANILTNINTPQDYQDLLENRRQDGETD